MDNQWSRMRAIVRSEIGESAFDRWIKILTLESWNGKTVTILAPTAAISSWVRQNYRQRLQQLWRDLNPDVVEIVIASPSELDADAEEEEEKSTLSLTPPFSDKPNQVWRFDNFIKDDSNRVACSVAQALPDTLSLDHSPLYIYGGVGLGKTHILHALANHIEQVHRSTRYLLLTAEKFAQSFVQALKQHSIETFKARCRSVDFLLLDDVHFFSGRDKTQEELMHTLDALQQANKRIALTADCAPGDLESVQPRVRSLLSGGLVCRVEQPSRALRRAIVEEKVKGQKGQAAHIPDEILDFVVENITESVRVLEGAINRIIIHATLREGIMTLDLARDLLKDLFHRTHRRITIDEIQQKVAEHYSLKSSELNSERRSQDIARPRQIAMYLAKRLTNRSMPEIGRKFGGRDHTTVMHAVKRVQGLRESDEGVGRDVQTLQRMLEN